MKLQNMEAYAANCADYFRTNSTTPIVVENGIADFGKLQILPEKRCNIALADGTAVIFGKDIEHIRIVAFSF